MTATTKIPQSPNTSGKLGKIVSIYISDIRLISLVYLLLLEIEEAGRTTDSTEERAKDMKSWLTRREIEVTLKMGRFPTSNH